MPHPIRRSLTALCATLPLILGLAAPLQAQTLSPAQAAPIERAVPVRGLSMNQITQRYGEPRERVAAVGKPPISRWVYNDFTVYFEHRTALHAVRNHPLPEQTRRYGTGNAQ
ncbi:MAG: hypothetical protein PHI49_08665 [Halothiobacillaceae bacterium]|jgi:hypothetical protein|nr:hypothetical protein [Halothiobacillaceae bacterium]MDY0050292.1 hypothetical protein [Halothiobacillaceae bacterium]